MINVEMVGEGSVSSPRESPTSRMMTHMACFLIMTHQMDRSYA